MGNGLNNDDLEHGPGEAGSPRPVDGASDAGRSGQAGAAGRAGATGRADYSHLGEQREIGPSDRRALTNRLRANAGLFGLMALGLLAIIVGGILLANAVSSW